MGDDGYGDGLGELSELRDTAETGDPSGDWPSFDDVSAVGLVDRGSWYSWADAGRDRFAELEARVGRLERLANDERTGRAER